MLKKLAYVQGEKIGRLFTSGNFLKNIFGLLLPTAQFMYEF
jgi:hypothetical protein